MVLTILHAQSPSNTQCVKALSEAKEICTRQPALAITPPASGAGITETAQAQFSDAFLNEVRLAAMAKECDSAISICEAMCPQASNPSSSFGDRESSPSGTTSICRETLSSYYETYLALSRDYSSQKQGYKAMIDAASAVPSTPTPTRSPTNETQQPSQRFWGFGGNF
ncbi:MAG: hypothetical protein IPK68_16940 [Bdellovibrionales bacterium]|nr:hypothetical protein [Bdellovibrionales bacterium]